MPFKPGKPIFPKKNVTTLSRQLSEKEERNREKSVSALIEARSIRARDDKHIETLLANQKKSVTKPKKTAKIYHKFKLVSGGKKSRKGKSRKTRKRKRKSRKH